MYRRTVRFFSILGFIAMIGICSFFSYVTLIPLTHRTFLGERVVNQVQLENLIESQFQVGESNAEDVEEFLDEHAFFFVQCNQISHDRPQLSALSNPEELVVTERYCQTIHLLTEENEEKWFQLIFAYDRYIIGFEFNIDNRLIGVYSKRITY